MKRAIFLALLLSSTAFAECYKEGDWRICPGAERTDKFSKIEGVGNGRIRYWQIAKWKDTSWTRYYEIDCFNNTSRTLQMDLEGDWLLDWEEHERAKTRELAETRYLMPGTGDYQMCSQIKAYAAKKAAEETAKKAPESTQKK